MPEFDPSTNGHKGRPKSNPPPRRGSGVLLMTLVSALAGLNLMIGAGIGAIVGALTNAGNATPALAAVGAGLGGAIGVVLGVRVAERFGGGSGHSSTRWLTGWALAGLAGSVALAAKIASPLTPILAIALPGLAAVIGDRYLARMHLAKRGVSSQKTKLRDQEAPE